MYLTCSRCLEKFWWMTIDNDGGSQQKNELEVFNLTLNCQHENAGSSPEVQWLGLCILTAEGLSSIPGLGTKIPQATRSGQNENASHLLSCHYSRIRMICTEALAESCVQCYWETMKDCHTCLPTWPALPLTITHSPKGSDPRSLIKNPFPNYTAIKKNEIMPFSTKWLQLEIIILSVENYSKDGNTRPPDLPPEKSVCRSGSNS